MRFSKEIRKEGEFEFIETMPDSEGIPLILLHGLMGALSNFEGIIQHFGDNNEV